MIDHLEAVKRSNPIQEVMARRGIVLRSSGRHLVGHCPFHQDGRPSLVVYPDTQSFFCFGCRTGGDVIDFVGRADGLSFREAVARLRGKAAGSTSVPAQATRLSLDDRLILTAACGVYHERLLQTPRALRYLQERGIDLPIVRRCSLGYSDGRSLLPFLQRRRLGLRRARELGLLWKGDGETMAGRIVIPELRAGQCIWMVGRTLSDERGPRYRGLTLPKPLLGYERVRGRRRLFVTEGPFDYLTGVRWGLPICALLGTHVRAGRLSFLERVERVLLVFDRDEPGQVAAADLAARLGARARIVVLPEGVKDLNDLGRCPDGRASFFQAVHDAESRRMDTGEEEHHVAPAS
jgi:DNA primase